jgi:hypothetical protein
MNFVGVLLTKEHSRDLWMSLRVLRDLRAFVVKASPEPISSPPG